MSHDDVHNIRMHQEDINVGIKQISEMKASPGKRLMELRMSYKTGRTDR